MEDLTSFWEEISVNVMKVRKQRHRQQRVAASGDRGMDWVLGRGEDGR